MGADDTKERILDAAERLFAEHGFDATSLRSVTAEAGANLAAVNYHFGSKSALLAAVVVRIVEPVSARQLARLEELEARESPPTVEELLEAVVAPLADFFSRDSERGPVLARLFARILGDPGDDMRRAVIAHARAPQLRFREAFAKALPELAAGELWLRLRAIGPMVVTTQLDAEAPPELGGPPAGAVPDRRTLLAWTLGFLAAAVEAPAASTEGAGIGPPVGNVRA